MKKLARWSVNWGYVLFGAILLTGAAFRIYLVYSRRLMFDSDQAIAGIGALRILREGKHFIMLPGQNFNGEFLSYYFLLSCRKNHV